MVLRIFAPLSAPPSSPTLFRDTTLFAKVFCDLDIVLECEPGTRSYYWDWLKSRGAHDFIDELVRRGEANGLYMGPRDANIRVDRINYHTIEFVMSCLYALKS